MRLKLIARHIRDDQDYEIDDIDPDADVQTLLSRMEEEIEANRAEGSNWRFSIVPHEEVYK
ncbi:MAG: hypothetical protein EOR34_10730 [Mesorhizobium sp.]|uniref:hypothetical protein n=1 Tax=Mesorhizobium sp. TaxID=1871066 RepID=UPI000FE9E0E2|nr:hypothetical protein [Mesorhizobium sp.]RWI48384.1 MAG: hypothetical protein EOR15_13560 [Mesorhizobium sp.]RWI88135.1 MAG: hypothetical protein EOR20_03615 [Mesorhizobium sp.]RWJ60107.1 MAG: hypothetical protein EOR32_19650 [Mesorhizobium sp.]RWJ74357.1 MAG: hypothetical protein EOR34_10730 [Mesorhizobium sp.]